MGREEVNKINKIILEAEATGDERLFRANAGVAWNGKRVKKPHVIDMISKILKKFKLIFSYFIIILNPRPFHGMPKGTPDIIGWKSKEIAGPCCGSCNYLSFDKELEYICDELEKVHISCFSGGCRKYRPRNSIKKKVAIFKAIEVKTEAYKTVTEEQKRFLKTVKDMGGITDVIK